MRDGTARPSMPPDDRSLERAFCGAAFDNLHVAIGGEAKPCCEFKGSLGNLKAQTVDEVWQGQPLHQFREKMLRGERDKRCWKCWNAEDAGGDSLRHHFNNGRLIPSCPAAQDGTEVETALPRKLDLRFSNLCNLSCRTCGPACSTKWYTEAKVTEWWKIPARHALDETFASPEAAVESLGPTLKTVESIYFAGGEPLLHEGHYAVVQNLISIGRTDVRLEYNTNLTELRLGKREIIPLWRQFKNVVVMASIDGHKELGELVREGLSWDRFVANVRRVRQDCPHVKLAFSITVSALNVLALPDICWALRDIDDRSEPEFHFNVLQEPERYSSQILPVDLKKDAVKRLEQFAQDYGLAYADGERRMSEALRPIVNFMMFADKPNRLQEFRARTLQLDQLRSRDTAQTAPELASLLQESVAMNLGRRAKEQFGVAAGSVLRAGVARLRGS